jgi:tRNA A37 threonylcarbamoyladenosine biosynthesis protein TsaE
LIVIQEPTRHVVVRVVRAVCVVQDLVRRVEEAGSVLVLGGKLGSGKSVDTPKELGVYSPEC